MGIGRWLKGLLGSEADGIRLLGVALERRPDDLLGVPIEYRTFTVPKRTGGVRTIAAPAPLLKDLQVRILRRMLSRVCSHSAAHGFERGRSIVTHARMHVGQAVVVRLDIQDFFPNTSAERVFAFYRSIGWKRPAAERLTAWCTWEGGLPQGAPTSPRLANLLNSRLDARLTGLARASRGVYSRYADDLTFSFAEDRARAVKQVVHSAHEIVRDEGYRLHTKKKLRIMRRHARQSVTGLVVNDGVRLPRATRRRLRAIRHHLATGRSATLTPAQLEGWAALEHMVRTQGAPDA